VKLISIAHEPLDDIAVETIDLSHVAKPSRAVADNLPGFEATVIEQVDQSLFPLVREHTLQLFPQLATAYSILHKWFLL